MNKKVLGLFIIILIAVGGGVWFVLGQDSSQTQISQNEEEIDTSDWKIYRNDEYGFEFKYPNVVSVGQELSSVSINHSNEFWVGTMYVLVIDPEDHVGIEDFLNSKIGASSYQLASYSDSIDTISILADVNVEFVKKGTQPLFTHLEKGSEMVFVEHSDHFLWFTNMFGANKGRALSAQERAIIATLNFD